MHMARSPSDGQPVDRRAALREPRALDGSPLVMRGLDGDNDLQGLCQLFSDVFGQPMDTSQWRWKYMQAPGSQHYHAVAAHAHTGQLLGHMGVIILPGVRGGQPIRMAHATDLMVSPLARTGLGPDSVYRHIMHTVRERALDAGPDAAPLFMYGFPGQRPATLAMRLGIQRRLQICTQYALPATTAPRGALAQWWARVGRRPLQAVAQPADAQFWSDAVLDPIWQHRAGELAVQAQTDPASARPSLVKNAAYLRWRYLLHPQQNAAGSGGAPLYTLWLLQRRGQPPCGWVVTRLQPQPIVVDSCLPGGPQAVVTALRALPPPATLVPASSLQPIETTWVSWLRHPQAQATETPIWATAMQGAQFHENWPSPEFQPGDTDVF